jgi:hypothetical protein
MSFFENLDAINVPFNFFNNRLIAVRNRLLENIS